MTGSARYSLATFQSKAKDALQGVILRVAGYHTAAPEKQREIALKDGVMLLESPTGSGKTLTVGRTMEGLRGRLERPTVWLWFAPFSGLVAQTRDALAVQCSGLRLRDVAADRETLLAQDGDVYVQTWATVAASTQDARKVRRQTEAVLSFDDMIVDLREKGFFIGVIIDEAHLNFGANAKAAADFYLNVISPDFTILASATPNDEKLVEFERKAGIVVGNRITVPRDQVVDAGLNKVGLKLGVLRYKPEERDFIDTEMALLTAAWTQHCRIVERLEERGITLTPLMLVQVENDGEGDPVARVRNKLKDIGVPEGAIASHTSGDPDPEFHTLAYDPDKQVLIFKVAAATGFDAPRAWTLASVRPGIGKEFGLQVVGRIMRVHAAVRPIHKQDGLLDSGYVFLIDDQSQAGLVEAADTLKAVKESISLVTDRLDVVELTNAPKPLSALPPHYVLRAPLSPPALPTTDAERQQRLSALINEGLVKDTAFNLPSDQQDRLIEMSENFTTQIGLFGTLPHDRAPTGAPAAARPTTNEVEYRLRKDLELPKALWRELPPDPTQFAQWTDEIAAEFCQEQMLRDMLSKRLSLAQVDYRELLGGDEGETMDVRIRMSPELIAQKAQLAFAFNDTIDRAQLKRAIAKRLMQVVRDEGLDNNETDVRRAIDMTVMKKSDALQMAIKKVQGRHARAIEEPIPPVMFGSPALPAARLGAYGVFPANMNREEQALAEMLDADDTGLVKWWLRNPENTNWAVRIMRPSGRFFFPDFVVGISGRRTPDTVALVEVKDDGTDGRLHSQDNREKIRTVHSRYRNVFWIYRSAQKIWVRAIYDESILDIR